MITNVSPEESFYYDTYCTLNFATKSRKIVNSNTASISVDRPAEPPKSLKRSHSESQRVGGKTAKHPKLSDGHSTSSHASPPPSADISPLGPWYTDRTTWSAQSSPLVQRQDHLERTVKGCMKKMEDLVSKIHLKSASKPRHPTSKPDPALAEIQRQLTQVQRQLKELEQHREKPAVTEQQRKKEQKPERRRSLRKALASVPSIDSVLKDRTNTGSSSQAPVKGVTKSGVWMTEDPSCSPLFVPAPSSLNFNKGFKSTACKTSAAPRTPSKFKSDAANFTSQQKKQNEEFLTILNTAPVRRLQELHTVGAKRARLIFDWRQAHGDFSSFDDLGDIPGFTQKYIHSLLQRNFILTDD